MKLRLQLTLLLLSISIITLAKQELTKNEILKVWQETQTTSVMDSLFRWDIHLQTRATLDAYLKKEVDTLLIYSVSYPGSIQLGIDTCRVLYPIQTYFVIKHYGQHFIMHVKGRCVLEQFSANENITKFFTAHYSQISGEFFMPLIYNGQKEG